MRTSNLTFPTIPTIPTLRQPPLIWELVELLATERQRPAGYRTGGRATGQSNGLARPSARQWR
jgi:hypothetical protein